MAEEPIDLARRGQWLRGVLDLCVLGLLSRGESYGYQLTHDLQSSGLGQVQGGTLYPVLLRLERAGLIESVWRSAATGPARKYYLLTQTGRTQLSTVGEAWLTFADRISEILHEGERDG